MELILKILHEKIYKILNAYSNLIIQVAMNLRQNIWRKWAGTNKIAGAIFGCAWS